MCIRDSGQSALVHGPGGGVGDAHLKAQAAPKGGPEGRQLPDCLLYTSKTALAKVLVSGCNLLILDEPTNHIDVYTMAGLEHL